jgi:hypothetical protein
MIDVGGNRSADDETGALPVDALPLVPLEDGFPVEARVPELPPPELPAPAVAGAPPEEEHAAVARTIRVRPEPSNVRIDASLQIRAYASASERQRNCSLYRMCDLIASLSTV